MNSVKSGRYSEYGTPPPFRKHSTILGSRAASMGRPWLLAARLRLDVPVRQTACSGGRENVREAARSEEHTSELQSRLHLVCRLLLVKKKKINRLRSAA